jgi:hypothetical protein
MATITIDELSSLTGAASGTGDKISIWDISAGEHKTITINELVAAINSLVDLTSQDVDCTTLDVSGDASVGDNLTVGASTAPDSGTPVWIRENDTSSTAVAAASLAVEKNTEAAISLLTSTGGQCRIYAGDGGDNDAGIIEYDHTNQRWEFTAEGSVRLRVETGHVRPNTDNSIDLGSSTLAWKDVYYEGTLNDTSDRRYKTRIQKEELGLEFIQKLIPVTYVMRNDPEQRLRHGFVAQDIEGTGDDFHGVRLNQSEDGSEKYTLDYTQIIGPLVKAVQELAAKVA